MNSFSILKSRQLGLFAAAGALLLALILPSIVSAAQLTERSIELSSSSINATGVTYKVNFTATTAAGAVIVDFCQNSPLIGETCTPPAGFNFTPSGSVAKLASDAPNTALITQAIAAEATSVTISGVTNPSTVGPLYARIITYSNPTTAATYVATVASDAANRKDEGGAALSITNTIGVSGAVLESMSFCVSGGAIADNCTGPITAPTLKLGQQVGSAFALVPGVVSEGSIYTQISTNALKGAVVSLKSSTTNCGGLVRAGDANCDIAPALSSGIEENSATAKFGVKTTASTNGTNGGSGTYQPAGGSIYSPDAFALAFINTNATGVTSPYGSPFLDTAGAPVNNKNMQLTFGATVTNQTPAGLYSADLSLIATGKF